MNTQVIIDKTKLYFIFILLYCSSTYHFVFRFFAEMNPFGQESLYEYFETGFKPRIDMLPVYGFETFTFMTMFLIIDYYLCRKPSVPSMDIKRFLDAYLFSQLAYIGYIYHFASLLKDIHAVLHGAFLLFLDIPMLIICFPISVVLFNRRLKKTMNEDKEERPNDNKRILIDYLIFWVITFLIAILAYGLKG